jgi:hypothetical protein
MSRTSIVALIVGLSLLVVAPAQAMNGHTMEDCPHEPTIEALHHCVEHATHHGVIDNIGIAASLHAKLDAVAAARAGGQTHVSIRLLEAFQSEIEAHSGKHIDETHAEHLLMHVDLIITALASRA